MLRNKTKQHWHKKALISCTSIVLQTWDTTWKSHKCPFCEMTFTRAGSIKRHLVVHTGEKPYECSDCGRRFTQSGTLRIHMKQIHSHHS